ncbi:MAG: hypothetical protein IMZ50_12705 [Candidatus Atribacteria bacterium]|nr:hypothetical protein [Candidatus Atribacteria bacterium]
MHYIPFLSTLVTFAFAAAVFTRYLKRRGLHLLLWTIGLLFYGIGTLSEVILAFTFSSVMLKLWYLSGAMLTAAWLGQGTIHLLVRKRGVAWTLTGILTAVSLLAATLILLAPLTPAAASYNVTMAISSQYKDILTRGGLTIALTILLNIYGTLTLVGGAIYSAFIFWRKRVLFNRMIGNVLIAIGAIAPAMAGSFVKMGLVDALYMSELIGVVLMYIGFIQATTVPVREAAPAAAG